MSIIGLIIVIVCIGGYFLFRYAFKKKPKVVEEKSVLPIKSPQSENIIPTTQLPILGYNAMVTTPSGIVFKKIPNKLGYIWTLDQSMPVHGKYLMVTEKEQGKYEVYDPRKIPYNADETPWLAYSATHWDEEAAGLYPFDHGMWDKLNMLLVWASVACLFIVAMTALG